MPRLSECHMDVYYSTEPDENETAFKRFVVDADKVRQVLIESGRAKEGLLVSQGDYLPNEIWCPSFNAASARLATTKDDPLPVPKIALRKSVGYLRLEWITEGTQTAAALDLGIDHFPVLIRNREADFIKPLIIL